jgi:hypothetical protein
VTEHARSDLRDVAPSRIRLTLDRPSEHRDPIRVIGLLVEFA